MLLKERLAQSLLHPFHSQCQPSEMVAGDGLDNDCDGKTDEEKLDKIDNDGDGKIDEDLQVVNHFISSSVKFRK